MTTTQRPEPDRTTPPPHPTPNESTPATTGDLKAVATTLCHLLASTLRLYDRHISLTSADTLETLERNGPRRITELAESEGVAQPSMTALVTGLEQAGLVERRRDPTDLRVVLVTLTPAGKTLLTNRRNHVTDHFAQLMLNLTPHDMNALTQATSALTHLWQLNTNHTI